MKSLRSTVSPDEVLKGIADLSESGGPVTATRLIERVGVKRPVLTAELTALSEDGFIDYRPRAPITLTMKGVRKVVAIREGEKTIEIFLVKILGFDRKKAAHYAEKWGEGTDGELTARLAELTDFIHDCPRLGTEWFRLASRHCRKRRNDAECRECLESCLAPITGGTVPFPELISYPDIPDRKGSEVIVETRLLVDPEPVTLFDLNSRASVEVVRILGNEKLRIRLEKLGFRLGTTLEVISPREPITVEINDEVVLLSEREARLLEVVRRG